MNQWFNETLYQKYGQRLEIEKLIVEKQTKFQDMKIFENHMFGKVLTLDGVLQTSEKDEFVYHEMMVHVPMFAHPNPKRVLVIGGGDGGIARDVLKHKNVEHVTMVEIDGDVVEYCRKYMPSMSDGAFEDPRMELIIGDGIDYVKTTDQKYDVIISDSTDPIGPGEVLYTSEYFSGCKRSLNDGGIFVNQNGVSFHQFDEVTTTYRRTSSIFKAATFYSAAVPGYIGGIMTFSWGTDNPEYKKLSLEEIRNRYLKSGIKTKYYTPEIHLASFALPNYILEALHKVDSEK